MSFIDLSEMQRLAERAGLGSSALRLVRLANIRLAYLALWSRSDSDEVRGCLRSDGVLAEFYPLWAVIASHDGNVSVSQDTWNGAGRVWSIYRYARQVKNNPAPPVCKADMFDLWVNARACLNNDFLASVAVPSSIDLPVREIEILESLSLKDCLEILHDAKGYEAGLVCAMGLEMYCRRFGLNASAVLPDGFKKTV